MITGYLNNSRGLGVRSHQLILPSVVCSTHLAKKIADQVGAITFSHQHGCGIIGPDVEGVQNYFVALASHPNVNSTVVLGLGCETLQGNELTDSIRQNHPQSEYVVIQESAGMAGALESSISTAEALRRSAAAAPAEILHLTIGVEGFPDQVLLQNFTARAEALGHSVKVSNTYKEQARNFADLVREKCQVIISFPDPNQPPTGLPLIPVLTVANKDSLLHQALQSEFDAISTIAPELLLEKLIAVASGELTKCERQKIGNIVVPRMVRSV